MTIEYRCPECLSPLPKMPPVTCSKCGNNFKALTNKPTSEITNNLDPDKPAWGYGAGIVIWLLSVFLIITAPLPAMLTWSIWMQLSGQILPDKPKIEENPELAIFFICGTFLAQILTLMASYRFITRSSQGSFFSALGWHWPERFGLVKTILFTIFIFFITAIIISLFPNQKTDMQKFIEISMAVRILVGIIAIIGAPFVEELIYRGILFAGLRRDFGVAPAIIGVSFLFLLVHIPQYWGAWGVIVGLGFLSLTLTLVRAYSSSLLPSFVIHLIFNTIQVVLMIAQGFVGE